MQKIDAIKRMYEQHPFPPFDPTTVSDALYIQVPSRLYFAPAFAEGKKILDAGCGTGLRLNGLARTFPNNTFQGIDMTERSLEIAQQTASAHDLRNVSFLRSTIEAFDHPDRFDLIISCGVIHCLEDPLAGLQNLVRHLSPDGQLWLWLYHPYGEHDRLLDRDLIFSFWRDRSDLDEGVRLMKALGLTCNFARYGGPDSGESGFGQTVLDVDAYLHPIVRPFRFRETFDLLQRSGLTWGAVELLYANTGITSIDLGTPFPVPAIDPDELFASDEIRQRFRAMTKKEQLEVIELAVRPTGYSVIAGRGDCAPLSDPIRFQD